LKASSHSGFTLVEVIVASGVLAVLSAGLLATTWAMVRFARGEAERMMADNLAHDVMRAVYSQKFDGINPISKCVFDPDIALPQIVSQKVTGKPIDPVCSLWRDRVESKRPYFEVEVTGKDATETSSASKTIKVTVHWWDGTEWQSHSPTEQVRFKFGDES